MVIPRVSSTWLYTPSKILWGFCKCGQGPVAEPLIDNKISGSTLRPHGEGYSCCWSVCGCISCFVCWWTFWCHCNDWHISGCSTIINLTTNFSYKRNIRSSRISSDIPYTPLWQICLIKFRYHGHYWKIVQCTCVFFTIPLYQQTGFYIHLSRKFENN